MDPVLIPVGPPHVTGFCTSQNRILLSITEEAFNKFQRGSTNTIAAQLVGKNTVVYGIKGFFKVYQYRTANLVFVAVMG